MKIIRYHNPELAAWSPFNRLSSWRDLWDSAFPLAGAGTSWLPPMDVFEDDEKITVQLEAAGMKKEDFDISLQDDTLSVSGKRESVETTANQRTERSHGSFTRTISLSTPVKGDAVKADYQDGVLTISLPKAEEARPRKIQVNLN